MGTWLYLQYAAFYIKNNGNLNLKFKFLVSGITGDAKLVEAIDFTAMADASWLSSTLEPFQLRQREFDLLKGYDVDTLLLWVPSLLNTSLSR